MADPQTALATALATGGPWTAVVRATETGERYIDLAPDASEQPVESIWFDPGRVVWGDEYQYSLPEDGDWDGTAQVILYTMRDTDADA